MEKTCEQAASLKKLVKHSMAPIQDFGDPYKLYPHGALYFSPCETYAVCWSQTYKCLYFSS